MIGKSGDRESGISVLPARHNDDDKRFKEGRESVRDDERCKEFNTPQFIGQMDMVRVIMLRF